MAEYGLVHDACYPYTSGDTERKGTCHLDQCDKMYCDGSSVKIFDKYDNKEMAEEIKTNGPIYMSMQVYEDFRSYKSGVYYINSTQRLGGHAVKIHGWGYDDEKQSYYWIAANSWGTTWGEQGFFNIGFNQDIGYRAGSCKPQLSSGAIISI
jgi:cysteine peptidase C